VKLEGGDVSRDVSIVLLTLRTDRENESHLPWGGKVRAKGDIRAKSKVPAEVRHAGHKRRSREVKAVVADVLGMDPTQEILDVRKTESTVLWYHARDLRGENLWFRGKEGNNFPGGLLRFAGKKVTLTAYLDASGRELKPKSSRTGEQSPFDQWKDKNYRKVKVKLEGGDVSRDVSIVLLTLRTDRENESHLPWGGKVRAKGDIRAKSKVPAEVRHAGHKRRSREVKAVVADVLGMDPTQEILDFLGTEKDV